MEDLPNYDEFLQSLISSGKSPSKMLYKIIYGKRRIIAGNIVNENGFGYENKIFRYIKVLCDFCSNPNEGINLAFSSGYLKIFKLLLISGGTPDPQCLFDIVLWGLNDLLELVLLSGVSANTYQNSNKDEDVNYILETAVSANNIEAVKILLRYGANVDNTNAYYYAKELGYNDILTLLHPHHMIS